MSRQQSQAPTAFGYWAVRRNGPHARVRDTVKRLTGIDLFPPDDVVQAFMAGRLAGDPVAERFVAETYHAGPGPQKARDLLERALATSIDDVPEAPESMRALFAEFERMPAWVDPELVELG